MNDINKWVADKDCDRDEVEDDLEMICVVS